ncbi:ankyrin repeat [Fusarium pseudocircinatum]|uniref:Ankyrin repeat n=1 Tax=Fusarium pseudocircinatum TaxID=56676 RepID=A0A8H5PCX3_9HYPO|nr:ankyrin repeat [Fusarium pseudocircinatum]
MPNAKEYSIGWICALSKELTAARAFLDVRHDPVDNAATNDGNNYTLGSIGKHNVVIAVLPDGQYGLVNAAATLKDMTRTYSNLRAVLMVGIGGGVPGGKKDIRLGDIVVGSVGKNSSGVIQHDFGRAVQGEEFAVTGHLNQPPMAFLTAMAALHSTYEMEGHSIESNIEKALKKYTKLANKYKRPEAFTDRLYESNFVHSGGEGVPCSESCSDDKLVRRNPREEDENNPAIHRGLIASGNALMKDALLRDKLAAKHGILCFEMEAAGLMNHFPCVAIRGICDYCDTHKNDEWQEYAAMAAAAYAKDLLLQVAPSSVQKEERIINLLGHLNEKVEDIHQLATESNRDIKSLSSNVQDDAILRWLNPADPSVDHNKARKAWHFGTGQWLLTSSQYLTWKSQRDSFLWLSGNSGTGKTVLSSTVIEDIQNSLRELCDSALLYFYITFTDNRKQSLEAILTSLISQLYYKCQKSRPPITSLFSQCGGGRSEPNIEQLKSTFREMLSLTGEVFIVIDALDEYRNRSTQRDELFAWIESFGIEPVNTHLLVTSRPENDIKASLETWANPGSIISMDTDIVGRDISEYIRDVVTNSGGFRRWDGHTSTLDEIVHALTTKADGVFRWVALQLERLKDCITKEDVNTTLRTLPTSLEETYHRLLNELTSTRRKYVIRILQFLAYSDIPMELEAAVDALAINPTAPPGSRFVMEERMPFPAEISSLCSTLFVAVSGTHPRHLRYTFHFVDEPILVLQLAHSSVKEFISSCSLSDFDGLLTETFARLTITELCLVYFLEIDWSLPDNELFDIDWSSSDDELLRSYHFIAFAAENWIQDASCPSSRFHTFTQLSRDLFSNPTIFKRWRKIVGTIFYNQWGWFQNFVEEQDQLFYASWSGDQNCVKMLIDSAAKGDSPAWNLGPALRFASDFGHLDTVALLLQEGADVNAEVEGQTLLSSAVEAGHTDVIALMIKQGADVNAQRGSWSDALSTASKTDRLDIMELLIEHGADVHGYPLHVASRYGHLSIAMHLVKNGADVNVMAVEGSALQAACEHGRTDIVKYLIEQGAHVDAQGGPFGTALCAASYGGHLDIVMHLVERGADVNAKVVDTALYIACSSGYLDIVMYLVESGADVDAPGGAFEEALQAAIHSGWDSVVEFLHDHKADHRSKLIFRLRFNPNARSTTTKWPLHANIRGNRSTYQFNFHWPPR